ncbi:unnamed protein product [Amoebophrya sp. A25]|nr:unnamed protein product [Amoebophrya sp. A25]|eukprot:GSA25T00013954001.1
MQTSWSRLYCIIYRGTPINTFFCSFVPSCQTLFFTPIIAKVIDYPPSASFLDMALRREDEQSQLFREKGSSSSLSSLDGVRAIR